MKTRWLRCSRTLYDRLIDAGDERGQQTERPRHEIPTLADLRNTRRSAGEHGLGDTGSAERRFPACDGGGAQCSDVC